MLILWFDAVSMRNWISQLSQAVEGYWMLAEVIMCWYEVSLVAWVVSVIYIQMAKNMF